MGKYHQNTNGSTELVLVKQNFLLRGIRDSRTLIVQVLIGAMHGLVVSILVIRNFALTEFALARLHCIHVYKTFYCCLTALSKLLADLAVLMATCCCLCRYCLSSSQARKRLYGKGVMLRGLFLVLK